MVLFINHSAFASILDILSLIIKTALAWRWGLTWALGWAIVLSISTASVFGQQQLNTKIESRPSANVSATEPSDHGSGLGRLLMTEAERKLQDDKRFGRALPPKIVAQTADAGPFYLYIDGISERPDQPIGQRVSIWINGRAYTENQLMKGLKIKRDAKGVIIGLESRVSVTEIDFGRAGERIRRPAIEAEKLAKTMEKATQFESNDAKKKP